MANPNWILDAQTELDPRELDAHTTGALDALWGRPPSARAEHPKLGAAYLAGREVGTEERERRARTVAPPSPANPAPAAFPFGEPLPSQRADAEDAAARLRERERRASIAARKWQVG